jgi:hypothetical protein
VLNKPEADLLPLVADINRRSGPGWCTYVFDFDSPEIEVFGGGLNSKTPTAAALWRQGHLFHFGFEPAPDVMNDTGRALLVNAIVYISRFTEDRPIPRTPSPFEGTKATTRAYAERVLQRETRPEDFKYFFDAATLSAAGVKDLSGLRAWYKEHREYLHAEPKEGKLTLDAEAQAFGTPPNRLEFFPKAIAALRAGGPAAERARRLLRRYAPEGPADGDAGAWETWWQTHRPYLFFSDAGWYRWYIDPLAKKRGVPTADLRGPARASKP